MNTIDELLARGRKVTENWINAQGTWHPHEQLLKVYEEVFEMQSAKTSLAALEEGCDVIYSVLTCFHLAEFDDYAIKEALESTMKKIEVRSENAFLNRNKVIEDYNERWTCKCGGNILSGALANCSPFYCGSCGTVYTNEYMEKMYAKQ